MDRVLAFGCHPDDVEFMCAGTLALLAQKGYEIHIATMTGGEVGHPTASSQEIPQCRIGEAAAAAKLIGATYHYAGGCDLEVEYSSAYRRLATRVVRDVDPKIILTHPPMDYLPDHEQTSLVVRNAAYIASVPLYDCGVPAQITDKPPHLYYWDASGLTDIFGRSLPLHFGVDISSVMDIKEKMLACHTSQREWLAYHNDWNVYTETMKDMTRKAGQRFGLAAGEGFIQHLGQNHPTDNLLKAILGELCVELDWQK